MGCFLVITDNDFRLADMMKQDMNLISRIRNPVTNQRELLVETDAKTAEFLQRFSSDARKSNIQDQHHLLPQLHKDWFMEKAGINIDEYVVTLDRRSHGQMTHTINGYKNAWKDFVEHHPGGSKEQVYKDVLAFATDLFDTFGFSGSGVDRYHRR